MAIINRKSGMVSGKIGDEVFYGTSHGQVVRKMPDNIVVKNTEPLLTHKAVFGELSMLWRELPENIKTLWEMYAAQQGSASEVESNRNVSYRYCPIPGYPPRPKKLVGQAAFVASNVSAYGAGISMPRLYPPLGASPSPAAQLDIKYERSSGELIVGITTPTIIDIEKADAIKAVVWITATTASKFVHNDSRPRGVTIVRKRRLDTFDITRKAGARTERRYATIQYTQKGYDYKPMNFADLPYIRVHLGSQVLVAPSDQTAPVISSGWFASTWLFNDTRYLPYEGLIESGQIKNVGNIKLGERFTRYVRELRDRLAQNEFAVYGKK